MLGILNGVAQGGVGWGRRGNSFVPREPLNQKSVREGIYKKILVHSPWLVLH